MKTVFLLLTLLLIGFVVVHRQRLYLRDPIAVLYRDEVKVEGAEVFINYSNDVLVQIGHHMQMEEFLIQQPNAVPGVPTELKCVQGVVCMAKTDQVAAEPLHGAAKAEMTNRQVSFRDGKGTLVRVTLR